MTIARGRPIVGKDVEDLVNANYPEFAFLLPPGGFKGRRFDTFVGDGEDTPFDGDQVSCVAVALIALGLPVRPTSDQTIASNVYSHVGDSVPYIDLVGKRVMAANFWQRVDGLGSDSLEASADAFSKLDLSGTLLGYMVSVYQTDPLGPFVALNWYCIISSASKR